jgi:penicillin-binding protein 1C
VLATPLLGWKTSTDLRSFPKTLTPEAAEIVQTRVLDRHGLPLSITYRNPWNVHEWVPLHQIPPLLQQAFILSEDKRFPSHNGVDWTARCHALVRNLLSGGVVRGASTISEQVTRMLHPRPRTIWSRWIEGFEARSLEKKFSKAEILEFYLNQVPYARLRRGAGQAARLYFNRDLSLLNQRELLALVILVRSPSRLDLLRNPTSLDDAIERLVDRLLRLHLISLRDAELARSSPLVVQQGELTLEAPHYVRHVLAGTSPAEPAHAVQSTTLDSILQHRLQEIMDHGLTTLQDRHTADGAILVADHRTGEVLAWVNGGGQTDSRSGAWIDAVILPRQPGSTLKPFLYGLALEKGWTAATLIDDSPLSEPMRTGLHTFRNYSRRHYGHLRLRDALGNSLNIPAVRTIQFTGTQAFLTRLRALGFENLKRTSDFYGQGLALGDGEVSLFELVQAYACLARGGRFIPLRSTFSVEAELGPGRKVFSEENASIIAHILSDPQARRLEFGEGHLLTLPVQTAVKTGTSSDYRDAWAVGFSHRHVVGVWMGNLDRLPTRGLTGTAGPGLILRAVFSELHRMVPPAALTLSMRLQRRSICQKSGLGARSHCPSMEELFVPGSAPESLCTLEHERGEEAGSWASVQARHSEQIELIQPVAGLQLAMDPRVPKALQAFALMIPRGMPARRVEWRVDGVLAGTTGPGSFRFDWPMEKGSHIAQARVWLTDRSEAVETRPVTFKVR